MITFLSSWAKGLGIAIVIVSILEMFLPNNKIKKYVKVVMGIYILFSIISPFIDNKEELNFDDVNFENYMETSISKVDQSSMDERIEELYIEELEKDITNKLEKQGYIISQCKVDAKLTQEENANKINKISIKVEGKNEKQEKNEESLEEKIVTKVQEIKKVNTSISNENDKNEENITTADIQNIKKFLIKEYEVNEKCLKIK